MDNFILHCPYVPIFKGFFTVLTNKSFIRVAYYVAFKRVFSNFYTVTEKKKSAL